MTQMCGRLTLFAVMNTIFQAHLQKQKKKRTWWFPKAIDRFAGIEILS